MRKPEPEQQTEIVAVAVPKLLECVCAAVFVCCTIIAAALLSKPWPI